MYLAHFKDELWTNQHNEEGESANTRLAIYNCAILFRDFQQRKQASDPYLLLYECAYLSFVRGCVQIGRLQAGRDFKQTVWTGKSRRLSHAEVNELHYLCSAEQAGSFYVLWDQGAKTLTEGPWNTEKPTPLFTPQRKHIGHLCKERQGSLHPHGQ